jgi:processing peptidase subunit beta
MMADCALEPRSVVAANVGLDKNLGTHKLEAVVQCNFNYIFIPKIAGEAFNEAVF